MVLVEVVSIAVQVVSCCSNVPIGTTLQAAVVSMKIVLIFAVLFPSLRKISRIAIWFHQKLSAVSLLTRSPK